MIFVILLMHEEDYFMIHTTLGDEKGVTRSTGKAVAELWRGFLTLHYHITTLQQRSSLLTVVQQTHVFTIR